MRHCPRINTTISPCTCTRPCSVNPTWRAVGRPREAIHKGTIGWNITNIILIDCVYLKVFANEAIHMLSTSWQNYNFLLFKALDALDFQKARPFHQLIETQILTSVNLPTPSQEHSPNPQRRRRLMSIEWLVLYEQMKPLTNSENFPEINRPLKSEPIDSRSNPAKLSAFSYYDDKIVNSTLNLRMHTIIHPSLETRTTQLTTSCSSRFEVYSDA